MVKENRTSSCTLTISASRTSPPSRKIAKQMQAFRERLLEFLFPLETDNWLAILRLGLGLQITLYSLSLRNDWNDLLGGAGRS